MMPGRDGLDLLEQLRAEGDALPVIMLAGRGDEGDRIAGLRLCADDYIATPFSPAELVARVTAVLRRGDGSSRREALEFDGLSIDMATRKVAAKGNVVPTTTKEFALLAFLAESPDHVFTREQLLEKGTDNLIGRPPVTVRCGVGRRGAHVERFFPAPGSQPESASMISPCR